MNNAEQAQRDIAIAGELERMQLDRFKRYIKAHYENYDVEKLLYDANLIGQRLHGNGIEMAQKYRILEKIFEKMDTDPNTGEILRGTNRAYNRAGGRQILNEIGELVDPDGNLTNLTNN